MKIQKNPWKITENILRNFRKPEKLEDLENLRKILYNHLNFLNLETEEQKREELNIRWKRTAEEILEQKIVYNGKACTDIVVCYMAFLKYFWIESSFVKLKKENFIHSVIEIFFQEKYYILDISAKNPVYDEAKFEEWKTWNTWTFWKKWKDSWDLWLKKYWDTIK